MAVVVHLDDRATHMIIRTYKCEDCGWRFEVECDSGNDPDPDCPNCNKVLEWVPARLNINTHKSKAVDLTQKIIEEDYGLSNLNDGNREGDVAYKPQPVMQTAERENIEQSVREFVAQTTANVGVPTLNLPPQAQAADVQMNFWGGGPAPNTIAARPIPAEVMRAAASQGPAADVNSMSMLQESLKAVGSAGTLRGMTRIVSRWRP